MTIHIDSLKIDAIIGLLDFERDSQQRVVIDLKADYIYSSGDFINYADLADMIEARVKLQRYELLEEALLDLKNEIASRYPKITLLELKISKPDILQSCTVALSHSWELA